MGVDDEYKMVAAGDESNDHLLERTGPITRSAYKKRSLFASIAIGALIGAALTFLFSALFAPQGYPIRQSSTDSEKAQVSSTSAAASLATTSAAIPAADNSKDDVKDKLDKHPVVADAEHTQDVSIADCGHTPDEARAKGCVFDVMMQLWTPPACYDSNLSERYLAAGNWTWWADPEATKQLSLDEMRKGEHTVIFVIQDYHKNHCIFAWEKLVRAMRNEWPLIEELVSYDHVMHCKHRTLSKDSEDVRGVRAPTGYTRCGLFKDWEGHLPANAVSSTD